MTYMAPPVTMGPAPVTAVEVAAPVMMAPPVTRHELWMCFLRCTLGNSLNLPGNWTID